MFKKFFRDFIYTFSSNLVTFLLNAIILMILPKLINTTEFGYFQYYVMVVGFTIFLHYGWIDGIYLRYSGTSYKDLDKGKLSGQFKLLIFFTIFQCIVFIIVMFMTPLEINKKYSIFIAIFAILFVVPKTYAYVLMQATSRFKEYSKIIISEKLVFGVILVIMISFGVKSFSMLVLSDLIGRMVAAIYGCYFCMDVIRSKSSEFRENLSELWENIKCGIFIMIANISSVLITGICQLVIENRWSIQTFGQVSLTFNISKTILVVINAVAIIFFPILKNTNLAILTNLYKNIRILLLTILFILILGYYPISFILELWLPQYVQSIKFMILLIPICIFECKTSLLLNTYLKLLRKERVLAFINVIVVALSLLMSVISAYLINNLYITVLTMLVSLALKSILLEVFITKQLRVKVIKDIILELCMVILFIVLNLALNTYVGGVLYLSIIIIYVLLNKKRITNAILFVKRRNINEDSSVSAN